MSPETITSMFVLSKQEASHTLESWRHVDGLLRGFRSPSAVSRQRFRSALDALLSGGGELLHIGLVRDPERAAVTVCVATICAEGVILGASDRLLTAGDVQFEPPSPKVVWLTNSIVLMTAGEASLQAQLAHNVSEIVLARVSNDPENWWKVGDVANVYRECYGTIKRRRGEALYLQPLGLDTDTFVSRQKELAPDLVRQLATELINCELPGIETIIAGVDRTGAHLFVARDSELSCHDSVGFCAIGLGANHATSALMAAKYSRQKPLPEALLLTFAAKKRAEIAPGVGSETDMFTMGPSLGTLIPVREEVLGDLGRMYQGLVRKEFAAFRAAIGKAHDYVEALSAKASRQEQVAPGPDAGEAPAGKKDIPSPASGVTAGQV